MRIVLLSIAFLFVITSDFLAFDLDIGYGNAEMKFNVKNQSYDSGNGSVSFRPSITDSGKGTRSHIGLIFDYWGLEYGNTNIDYDLRVPSSVFGTTEDQDAKGNVSITNYGLNLHLRREIGGLSAGVGLATTNDKVTLDDASITDSSLSQSSSALYYKYGFDLLFGALGFQINTIVTKVGNSDVRVNSFQVMLAF